MPRRTDPHPLAQSIGLRIKQLRSEQGITAEKLAYESEVGSKGFLSDIEHGLALPSLTTLERIAQRLEISLFDLLVVPARSNREMLIELTRGATKGTLARLLRDLSDASSAPQARRLQAVTAYPSLEVAAGWSRQASPIAEPHAEKVSLPGQLNTKRDFAVRAFGNSMAGFRSTIRDGDWLLMRRSESAPGAFLGKVVLVMREDEYSDRSLHLKRVAQSGQRFWLRSDEPSVKAIPVRETDRVLATLVAVVSPESMAPPAHTQLPQTDVAAAFGIKRVPSSGWSRIEGHLFFVYERAAVKAKRAMLMPGCVPRPAETAFVLVSDGHSFEYLGVAHHDATRASWRLRGAIKR
jgi:transcriptional regulator with XRE-family HTH domain